MRICIYCLERKSDAEFNREHVPNEAFGKFEGHLILDYVCEACNQYFGDGIDRKLARDSIEGRARFWTGLHAPSTFKSEGRRSTTRVELPGTSVLGKFGFHVRSEDGSLQIRLHPQVGFRLPSGDVVWYRVDDVPQRKDVDLGYEPGTPHEVYFHEMSPEDGQKLLDAKGYGPSQLKVLQSPGIVKVRAQTIGTIDRMHERAISKIAFNYFAWVAKSIARADAFHAIRNFIRHDIGEFPLHVTKNPWAFFKGETTPARGHYLSVETMPDGQVVAQVSLFLHIRYMMRLLSVPLATGGLAISSAHFCDIESKAVVRLPQPLPPGVPGEELRPVEE